MTERRTADNTCLAKVAVQCSADTLVVNQSLVLRINIFDENRHIRQARNRPRYPWALLRTNNALLGEDFARAEEITTATSRGFAMMRPERAWRVG